MDNVLMNMQPTRIIVTHPANPVDRGWNIAVRHLATVTCPRGWKEYPTFAEAPTTLEELIAHADKYGQLGIATEDSEGTLFDCADTNVHLRAWHDSVHLRHKLSFTVAGEAAAVYVQAAQVYRLYGVNDQAVRWVQLLLADILGLVIYHKQTGKYPKNKRAGTVNAAPKWKQLAQRLGQCTGDDHEQAALAMAKLDWGNPHVV